MKKQIKTFPAVALVLAILGIIPGTLQASAKNEKPKAMTYVIDTEHSAITFKVRHLVGKVKGDFKKFNGEIYYDPSKPEKSWTKAMIDVNSIDTGVEKRDQHLLTEPSFFNAKEFPTMKFETTKLIHLKDQKGQLVGKLTMRGVTKNVIIDVQFNGMTPDPFVEGRDKIGFTGTTKINRNDFGITWNMDGKDGQVVIGDEIEISLEIEGHTKS